MTGLFTPLFHHYVSAQFERFGVGVIHGTKRGGVIRLENIGVADRSLNVKQPGSFGYSCEVTLSDLKINGAASLGSDCDSRREFNDLREFIIVDENSELGLSSDGGGTPRVEKSEPDLYGSQGVLGVLQEYRIEGRHIWPFSDVEGLLCGLGGTLSSFSRRALAPCFERPSAAM